MPVAVKPEPEAEARRASWVPGGALWSWADRAVLGHCRHAVKIDRVAKEKMPTVEPRWRFRFPGLVFFTKGR